MSWYTGTHHGILVEVRTTLWWHFSHLHRGLGSDAQQDYAASSFPHLALSLALSLILAGCSILDWQVLFLQCLLLLLLLWFFETGFLCSFGACPGTSSVDQAGLELCLPLPPECWDESCAPPPPSFFSVFDARTHTAFWLPKVLTRILLIILLKNLLAVVSFLRLCAALPSHSLSGHSIPYAWALLNTLDIYIYDF